MAGKEIRLSRLFNPDTGRSVVIPVDHGLIMGNVKGLSDPIETLKKLLEIGIDATLMSPGIGKFSSHLFEGKNAPARILTVDFPMISNIPGGFEDVLAHELISSVEYAVRWAYDVVKVLFPWGSSSDVQIGTIKVVSSLAEKCDIWGMPLMVEPVLWGSAIPDDRKNDPELLESAARVALELGADVIKMPYTGDVRHFSSLVKRLRVPVLVLGGPKMESVEDMLSVAKESVEAGARGIVFGRNVWQNPNMENLLKALKDIVHRNAEVEEVMKKYGL